MARETALLVAALALLCVAALLPSHVESRTFGERTRLQRFLRHLLPLEEPVAPQRKDASDAATMGDFVEMSSRLGLDQLSDFAMAPAPSPPQPPVPNTCPPTVGECDFFFEGTPSGSVPVFNITGASPDSAISPSIQTSVQGSAFTVNVMNSGKSQYICNDTAIAPDDQFYTNGKVVQVRTIQVGTLGDHLNQYVRLNLTAVQINAFGMTFNLNPGEGNNFFAEDRRCVIFQTA